VRVLIAGAPVENVIRLPIAALREGGFAWVANGGDRLEIRPVEVLWQDREQFWVARGIAPGERVVVSRIGTPIPNLQLRVEGAGGAEPAPGARGGAAEARP